LATPPPAGFVVLHRPSKALLRERGGSLGLPKTTGFAGHVTYFPHVGGRICAQLPD
jgi:hypothetical protein